MIQPLLSPIHDLSGVHGVQTLLLKDESVQPTGTFKARLAHEMVRPLILELQAGRLPGPVTFASISYGNTAKAMGYYCRELNELAGEEIARAVAFVPPHIEHRVFGPDSAGRRVTGSAMLENIGRDCTLVPIDLKGRVWRSADLEVLAREAGVVIGEFVDITEGLDRPAYVAIIREAIEMQLTDPPDYCIVPFGAGILCNEIIDYVADHELPTKVIPVSSGDPATIAVMLYGPIWVDVAALRETGIGMSRHDPIDRTGRSRTPYPVYHVGDDEIREAFNLLNARGISAEPSGASGIALLKQLETIDPNNKQTQSVLVINTGNSLPNYS